MPSATPISDDVTALKDVIRDLKTASRQPQEPEGGILERLEAVERRVEMVHKDSIKYLQKAAAAEQRAREIKGTDDDDDEMTGPEARELLAQDAAARTTVPTNGRLSLAELENMGMGDR